MSMYVLVLYFYTVSISGSGQSSAVSVPNFLNKNACKVAAKESEVLLKDSAQSMAHVCIKQ